MFWLVKQTNFLSYQQPTFPIHQVLSKFNREGRGFADFLDFVTYVPLFIEIHNRIIEDPFNDSLNV